MRLNVVHGDQRDDAPEPQAGPSYQRPLPARKGSNMLLIRRLNLSLNRRSFAAAFMPSSPARA
jgi:hypothetical protein